MEDVLRGALFALSQISFFYLISISLFLITNVRDIPVLLPPEHKLPVSDGRFVALRCLFPFIFSVLFIYKILRENIKIYLNSNWKKTPLI